MAPRIVPVPPDGPRHRTREASGLLTLTAGSPPTSTSSVTGTPNASPIRASVARLGLERPCSSATSTPLLTPERAASWSSDQPRSARSACRVRATAVVMPGTSAIIPFPYGSTVGTMNYTYQYSDRGSDLPEEPAVVTILALAAAVLYGTADFLGGVASRRASVFAVLALTVPAGAVVMLLVALLGQVPALGGLLGHGGLGSPASVGNWSAVGWAAASGVCGAAGLVAFYAGFATAPISVVAPVAALVSAVLPVGVAIAGGERPAATVIAGGLICLVAIVLVSAQPADHEDARGGGIRLVTSGRLRALGYGAAAGAGFGLFFIFLKNAGQSGVLWPVAISRSAGTVVALGIALATRTRPRWGRGGITGIALISGAIDAAANVCYVLATRAGLFGLAVVITSLYPGMTVLLARVLLGERMRWLQRAGLLLAAAGVVLVTVQPG